jgi:hypothetical protein
VALDSSVTLLFVADFGNNMIRQIVIATQTVTTLAGSGAAGAANGVGVAAQFNGPQDLALDASGNLFVSDAVNNQIRLIVIATKAVTTLAGPEDAGLSSPAGLFVARDFLIVADRLNHRIRMLQPTVPCPAGFYCASGSESMVACTPGFFCAQGADRALCSIGFYCPSGSSAQVACPAGVFHCPAGASAPVSIACAAGYDPSFSMPRALPRALTPVFILDSIASRRDGLRSYLAHLQARFCAGHHHVRRLHGGILLRGRVAECVWRHQRHRYNLHHLLCLRVVALRLLVFFFLSFCPSTILASCITYWA